MQQQTKTSGRSELFWSHMLHQFSSLWSEIVNGACQKMAGRGRGRGRGGMSFAVETLGFGRGESLPGPTQQPPPLFPVSKLRAYFHMRFANENWQLCNIRLPAATLANCPLLLLKCVKSSVLNFQPLEYKPVPLDSTEEQLYLLALKEEYRGAMRESPYYILPANKKKDIERYSDKYNLGGSDNSNNWEPGSKLTRVIL